MSLSQTLPPASNPSPAAAPAPSRAAQWLRLACVLVFLTLCILVPFALWGDALDQATPAWLGRADHAAWLAALGIALLVADVLLPIPSSVVGMALCWTLGPLWGGAAFALGLTLSFALGYALGRLVPEHRIRHWVGAPLWDAVSRRARHQALWWIVAARPLPLLAEMSALLAGVWRLPTLPALAMAALSSCIVAALYAGSAWLGLNQPGMGITLLATLTLPTLTWVLHRVVVQRISAEAGAPATGAPAAGASASGNSSKGAGKAAGAAALLAAAMLLATGPAPANAQTAPAGTAAKAGKTAKDSQAAAHHKMMSAIHTYYTGGVHNDKRCKPPQKCIHPRGPGEPTNPIYPKWWTSDWTMYRVFNNYEQYPPPYASPPAGLTPADYQVSYGWTAYDDTYVPKDRDGRGAMMEHYEKFCLPIFPMANNFTCSFVSLGNKAYFLRYDDRPAGTPECCQFSLHNHPPRRDFIKHLPYNAKQSTHLDGSVQAYSRLVGPHKILFGYSFYKEATSDDPTNPKSPKYRHPQSFFFSGYYDPQNPGTPPDAPIVSQNYTNFAAKKPDPATTWDQVPKMCSPNPGWCCLFAGDCPGNNAAGASPAAVLTGAKSAPATWADMDAPAK